MCYGLGPVQNTTSRNVHGPTLVQLAVKGKLKYNQVFKTVMKIMKANCGVLQ